MHWKTTTIQPELPATLQPLSWAFSVSVICGDKREIGLSLEALVSAEDELLTSLCSDQAGVCGTFAVLFLR